MVYDLFTLKFSPAFREHHRSRRVGYFNDVANPESRDINAIES
jgi:hypothetical protein